MAYKKSHSSYDMSLMLILVSSILNSNLPDASALIIAATCSLADFIRFFALIPGDKNDNDFKKLISINIQTKNIISSQ